MRILNKAKQYETGAILFLQLNFRCRKNRSRLLFYWTQYIRIIRGELPFS